MIFEVVCFGVESFVDDDDVPSQSNGCSASETFAFKPIAATVASNNNRSSVGKRYCPANDNGNNASPRVVKRPSRNCSAFSLIPDDDNERNDERLK
ncbi:hypothetical protein DERP_007392 [Dermatophagoides pteronyssinus]|uniref:Uncharacterized protein n=1 Tax=Dermatophagoides pteronyssinus TaxID=6956 RepID=A0ABQ8J4A0_DERPT|nr:hypothetical protein DERP_007392 [Dermatophagoides pteronyssinus]